MSARSGFAVSGLTVLALAALVLSGCGEPRRHGDVDGQPVAFQVRLEPAFLATMVDHSARSGVMVGSGPGGGIALGVAVADTEVYLLGDDRPRKERVFRQKLVWGNNDFAIPLKPGRTLSLTVEATGSRQGWDAIGTLTVPDPLGGKIGIRLDERGTTWTAEIKPPDRSKR